MKLRIEHCRLFFVHGVVVVSCVAAVFCCFGLIIKNLHLCCWCVDHTLHTGWRSSRLFVSSYLLWCLALRLLEAPWPLSVTRYYIISLSLSLSPSLCLCLSVCSDLVIHQVYDSVLLLSVFSSLLQIWRHSCCHSSFLTLTRHSTMLKHVAHPFVFMMPRCVFLSCWTVCKISSDRRVLRGSAKPTLASINESHLLISWHVQRLQMLALAASDCPSCG